MGKYDPIAYTYEADIHCPDCAEARFGRGPDGFIASLAAPTLPIDREGNLVGAVAPWDEWHSCNDYDLRPGQKCYATLNSRGS